MGGIPLWTVYDSCGLLKWGVTVNGACPKYRTVGEAVSTPENARDSQAVPLKDRTIGVLNLLYICYMRQVQS